MKQDASLKTADEAVFIVPQMGLVNLFLSFQHPTPELRIGFSNKEDAEVAKTIMQLGLARKLSPIVYIYEDLENGVKGYRVIAQIQIPNVSLNELKAVIETDYAEKLLQRHKGKQCHLEIMPASLFLEEAIKIFNRRMEQFGEFILAAGYFPERMFEPVFSVKLNNFTGFKPAYEQSIAAN